MEAIYNQGSIAPGHTPTSGGFTLYSLGPTDLSKGTEVTFSYCASLFAEFLHNIFESNILLLLMHIESLSCLYNFIDSCVL